MFPKKKKILTWFDFVSERDAFDTLFDHAPDKLNLVKKVYIFNRIDGAMVSMLT